MRFFLVLLLAALAHGQVSQQAQPSEPVKKARIEGSVVSLAGGPIPRATIRLSSPARIQDGVASPGAAYSATSDDAGKFVIEDIDPGGNFQLSAQRTGYVNARYGARSVNSPGAPLVLEAGASLKGITLTMTPQGVVTGRVTDATGDPIQGVMVALMRRGYQRGVRQMVPSNTATTNDQGEYRIANLSSGRYYLNASSRNIADIAGANTSLPTFYPNAVDAQGAAPIDVAVGQELRGIDIRLRQGRAFTVRGKALDAAGAPLVNAILSAMPKEPGTSAVTALALRSQAQTRADGSFEIRGLTSGAYTVQIVTPQAGTTRNVGRAEINVADQDVGGLVLTVSPGAKVTGTVRLEDGDLKTLMPAQASGANPQTSAALAIAATNAGAAISGLRVTVGLVDATPQPLNSAQPGQVKDDGTFTIENVPPGKFMMNVAALPQGVYVKSARFNGADVTRSEVDLTNGSGGNLDIVLSKKAANVTGMVTPEKDESVAGMIVSLWTGDPEPGSVNNGVRMATSDQNGGFQFQNLRPGTYYAAAWEDIDTGLAQARDFLKLMTGDAVKLEVAEGGQSSAQLKIVPTAKIKAAEEKLP